MFDVPANLLVPHPLPKGFAPARLWRVNLQQESRSLDSLFSFLSPEEIERAEKFNFPDLKRRYIVAHGALRLLLSRMIQCPPAQLAFTYSTFGKPCLAGAFAKTGLQFNLSHSHELALIAVSDHRQVGVDIEHIRELPDKESVIQAFFAPGEKDWISNLPADQSLELFFQIWCCKEALLKAQGLGLGRSLAEVQFSPQDLRAISSGMGDKIKTRDLLERKSWQVGCLPVPAGYKAAIALEILS